MERVTAVVVPTLAMGVLLLTTTSIALGSWEMSVGKLPFLLLVSVGMWRETGHLRAPSTAPSSAAPSAAPGEGGPLPAWDDEIVNWVADDDVVPQPLQVGSLDRHTVLLSHGCKCLPMRGLHVARGEVVEGLVRADNRADLELHVGERGLVPGAG